jgi:hypothetical protein
LSARVFKTKAFARFADKSGIDDESLCRAVSDASRGLLAADLGGGVIKQRIAREGQGKSGGFRTLIVFRARHKAFFVHGFAKNETGNIDRNELKAVKRIAAELLGYDDPTLQRVIAFGTLVEVTCAEETVS